MCEKSMKVCMRIILMIVVFTREDGKGAGAEPKVVNEEVRICRVGVQPHSWSWEVILGKKVGRASLGH